MDARTSSRSVSVCDCFSRTTVTIQTMSADGEMSEIRHADRLSVWGNWYGLLQELHGRPSPPVRAIMPFRLSPSSHGFRLQIWRRDVGGVRGAVYAEVEGSLGHVFRVGRILWRREALTGTQIRQNGKLIRRVQ